ncbi:hypothetical protein [Salirhabdus salicampi]|uniref:hypothetical protein n=1 Tax=Salirhabdus salicampi TaxID=476102 RepID=UPI0020C2C613|nr:hypothetical protein [Salirhabdus salicampi]MCP8617798.1 hypothetical protein [Salirhabdus salicampi]
MGFLTARSLPFIILLIMTNPHPMLNHEINLSINYSNHVKSHPTTVQRPEVEKLTHEDVVSLTRTFMDKLVQETDEQYRVIHFHSKRELVGDFRDVSSLSLAKRIVDLYYKEHDNQLYIIPTETPPWFVENQPYEQEIEGEQVKITQYNKTELYGNYKITLYFILDEQHGWIIEDVQYD